MTIEVTIENNKLVINNRDFSHFYLVAVIQKISLSLSQINKMFRKSIVLLIILFQQVLLLINSPIGYQ